MKFQFDSLQDMLSMSGHGPYVWACYALTLAVLLWLLVNPLVKQRKFVREQRRLQQLQKSAGEKSIKG